MSSIAVDTIENISGSHSANTAQLVSGSAKAWVNFNGVPATGTYNLPNLSSTLSVGITNHGLAVGMIVTLDFTTGTMPDGYFTVTGITDANTFTVDAGFTENGGGRSGNVTRQCYIRSAYNVSHITDNGSVGDFTVNFITPMANTYYANVMSAGRPNNQGSAGTSYMASPKLAVPKTTTSLRMTTAYADTTFADPDDVSVIIFGI